MYNSYLILSLLVSLSGCNISLTDNEDIEVYISTNAVQCEYAGLSIEETKGYLLAAGIAVKAQSCGYTLDAYPAVCGGGNANIHVFTINKADATVAENIGFTIPKDSTPDDDYKKVECAA